MEALDLYVKRLMQFRRLAISEGYTNEDVDELIVSKSKAYLAKYEKMSPEILMLLMIQDVIETSENEKR